MKPLAAILLFTFWASTTSEILRDRLLVWNVGQGLWITLATSKSCSHIDMGGEKIDWSKLIALCGRKPMNLAFFTHWDLDHISFAEQASKRLRGFCIAVPPRGPTTKEKVKTFAQFKRCAEKQVEVTEVKFPPDMKSKKPNDHSRVFESKNVLLPGDSTAKQERIWSRFLSPQHLKYLVLGHHGSKTSTSESLLRNLPRLRLAVASARKKRYGHPHRIVIENLDRNGVAMLSTEHWNNVILEL